MTAKLLTLNSSKTEFLLIGLRKQLEKMHNSSPTTHSADNVGFIFEEHLTFSDQISAVSKACYNHIIQIQNSVARIVAQAPKCCHITPILCSLHWLKITERIEYKLVSLTFKVLTTTQPPYLHILISVQRPRSTCSSSLVTLARPSTSSSLRITSRSFRYASLCLWNDGINFLVFSVNLISAPLSLSWLFMLLAHLLTLSTHHSHHP